MEDDKVSLSVLISSDVLYREHFTSLFEELWKNGIDATDRIKEIEGGSDQSSFDVENINSPIESTSRAYQMAKSAKKEIMMLYPMLVFPSVRKRRYNTTGKGNNAKWR